MNTAIVHIIDHNHKRRAQLARCALTLGHHAEVYEDAAELVAHNPRQGVVIALEDALDGGVAPLISLINREGKSLRVVATSLTPTVEKAVAAVKDGASDYLPLPIEPPMLARTLSTVSQHDTREMARVQRRARARQRLSLLSPREREVLQLLAAGLSHKEVGAELGISSRTVEIHRSGAVAKSGSRSTMEAVRIWVESEFDLLGEDLRPTG